MPNIEITIEFKGVELEIIGNYTPEEPMTMYYSDMSGHPGSPSELEVEKIIFDNTDVYDIYESLDAIFDIADKAIEKYEER